jgi:hypothetical protein
MIFEQRMQYGGVLDKRTVFKYSPFESGRIPGFAGDRAIRFNPLRIRCQALFFSIKIYP